MSHPLIAGCFTGAVDIDVLRADPRAPRKLGFNGAATFRVEKAGSAQMLSACVVLLFCAVGLAKEPRPIYETRQLSARETFSRYANRLLLRPPKAIDDDIIGHPLILVFTKILSPRMRVDSCSDCLSEKGGCCSFPTMGVDLQKHCVPLV